MAAGSGGVALLERTRRTVDLLRVRSQCVRVAALACCEQADLDSARYRAEIATQLLIAIAPAALGRLFLCTGDRPSLRLRQRALSLAGVLCHELRGTTSAVAVRFGTSSEGCLEMAEHRAGIGAFRALPASRHQWLDS